MAPTKLCPRCGDEYDASVAFCAKDGTRLVVRGVQNDLVGAVIADRYRIVSRIGEGGMGQVYLAEHVRMKRKSAIKIMRQALVGDVEALQRFTREAENASQIAHPNVAAIFDFGETADGIVYLAMEYVDGSSLAGKLGAEHALHPDVAADILGQAADALQAAHDLGILHRDLKPDNIMLGKRSDGTFMVKLVDFGIARTMDGADQKVTRTGFAIGTPAFMSPEQLAGDSLDARSDQYSLALVAFMALTGKDAFPAESSKESLIARLTSRPRTLQEAKEDVQWPEELQLIFDRALSPEPTERFDNVSEFSRALSTAISRMTPSQTAELYRRALDIRLSHVAARTPHGDLQALRTPASPLATVTPSESRDALPRAGRSGTFAPVGNAPTGSAASAAVSGTFTPIPDTTKDMPAAAAAAGGAAAASGAHPAFGAGAPTVSDGSTHPVGASAGRSAGGANRMAMVAGAVVLVAAVGGYLAFGRGSDAPGSVTASAPIADSTPTVAVGASAMATPDTGSRPGAPGAAGAPVAGTRTAGDSIARDSIARAKHVRDSVAFRKVERAYNDSVKARERLVASFPQRALSNAAAGRVDLRQYTATKDGIRATIMSPMVSYWRAAQIRRYKDTHTRPNLGIPYDAVDPIEVWASWDRVAAGRAVYVVEVGPERLAEPGSPEPEKLYDMRRGDIGSVLLVRDGAQINPANGERIPAVVNDQGHRDGGKVVFNEYVGTLGDSAFAPRPDGKMPKFFLSVRDNKEGKNVSIDVPERMARLLWADFQQYRDMIAALTPLPPPPVAPWAGATPAGGRVGAPKPAPRTATPPPR